MLRETNYSPPPPGFQPPLRPPFSLARFWELRLPGRGSPRLRSDHPESSRRETPWKVPFQNSLLGPPDLRG